MPPAPPRTPLRRVSQGSLRALSRSGTFPDAPEGLGFLAPALSELADEADALHASAAGLARLGDALHTFGEGFASYLYILEMNALTTDWPQAPTETSFELAKKRADDDARAALAALRAAEEVAAEAERAAAAAAAEEAQAEANNNTLLAAANASSIAGVSRLPVGILKNTGGGMKKKIAGKPKMTAKERKERNLAIEKVVSNLPLEYRGQDPTLRRNVEAVIERLMDNPNGLEMLQFVSADLPQARVNKCLLALINRKIVAKDNSTGHILYHWIGVPA